MPRTGDERALLRFGIVAGPFYVVLGLVQALVRDGFDLSRHPLSLLANGPGGWIQTANFALTGAMVVAAAVGLRRALAPALAPAWFLGAFGVGMLLAAVFPADPVDGFPPGTPPGFPASMSTAGLLHFVAGALGFTCLAISCLLSTRALSRRGDRGLARLSAAAGIVVLAGFFAGPAMPSVELMTLGIWIAVLAGWAWLTTVSLRLTPSPPSQPSFP